MDWDVVVIGAGPAGCFTAMQIANSGFKVLVIEEHTQIGLPIQCSGLVSPRVVELAKADESTIINSLTGLRVLSPLGAELHVNSSRVLAFAIDRAIFDQILAEKAENAGAILQKGLKGTAAQSIPGGYQITAVDKNNKNFTFNTKILIGADGVESNVAAWLGLNNDNLKAVMYSADVELACSDTNSVSVFLGQNLAPGWFGWIIPLDLKNCRLGIGYALIKSGHSPRHYFQQLIDYYPQLFKGCKIIRNTGGTVPLGLMPKIYASNAMLVGDAANQTKPISGGGIYMSLRASQICADVAIQALNDNNFSEEKMSIYQTLWENEMKEEINSAMKLRLSFLNLKDKDIESVIRFLNKAKYKELIAKYADIDYPSLLACKLFDYNPWLKVALKIVKI